jgi:hypothetical protein
MDVVVSSTRFSVVPVFFLGSTLPAARGIDAVTLVSY